MATVAADHQSADRVDRGLEIERVALIADGKNPSQEKKLDKIVAAAPCTPTIPVVPGSISKREPADWPIFFRYPAGGCHQSGNPPNFFTRDLSNVMRITVEQA
jgi:hypothetical protein